eukprot:jgi/Psemu1/46350/gm1.46350_g
MTKQNDQTEQNSGARQVFARLCKKVQSLREDPKMGKNLEKMMLERFKSEKNPTVSKDGGTVASSLAEEENEDDNYIDPVLMQLLGQLEESQNNHWDEELDRDGGDSDEEGSLAAAFDVQMGCKMGGNNSKEEDVDDNENNNNKNDDNELHVRMQDGYYNKDGTLVEEATTYSKPPQDYSPSDNNKSKLGEPSWHDVDNPSAWNCFCSQSKFEKSSGGRYMYHKLPSGCTPGWMFPYQNWVPEEVTPTFSSRYTSSRDLFPQERKGKLDMAKLRKDGLQLARVLNSDALFFYQLLPFHTDEKDEKQEKETRRKPLYSKVLNTATCMPINLTLGKGYNRLLCKDDMSKFNYAYKFDYIYETLVHNVHYFSKKACSDLCMDELSWAYYGFGEPMVDYLKGKMFSRSGQTVILTLQKATTPQY